MKKIFTLFMLSAVIFLASGCQKENFTESTSPVFTATIADATRTSFDDTTPGKVNWVAGDEITINGVVYVATPDETDASCAVFNKKNDSDADPVPVEGYYYATYCCSYDAQASEGEIPASRNYTAGVFSAPMYAESETTSLAFHNICGLLELKLKGEVAVKSIEVSAENAAMTGAFVIYDAQTAIILDATKNPSILDCGEGVALNTTDATSFYVPVPDGQYTGLTISIYFADGGKQVFGKGAKEVEIAANGLYTISLNVESKKDVTAQLPTGTEFNIAIKKLVATNPSAVSSENVLDMKIKKLMFVTESSNTEGVEIQTAGSANKIYISANADNSVVTVSTPAKVIYANENSSRMFAYFGGMSEIENLAAINTEKVTDMSRMFYMNNEVNTSVVTADLALKYLDLSSFNTSNVTNFASMFNTCWNLETIVGLDKFDTSKATNMQHMFCNCNALKSVDFSSFNTSNVTNMTYMFYSCKALTSLDLSSFNTSNVTNMSYMFYSCETLTSVDLSSFNTSNVTTMSNMFYHCYALTGVDLSGFNTSNVTNMSYMFCTCDALTSVDLSGFNTSNVTTMTYMFYHCWGLTSLDLRSFNTEKVTNFAYMFYYCKNIETLDVSSFSTPAATTMQNMFNSCYKVKKLDLSKFNGKKLTTTTSGGEKIITGVSYMMNQLGALEELWLGPDFASKPYVVYTSFFVPSKTQSPANKRTGTCNTTGTLIIHCTQTIAEWCVTVGAFKWVNSGYDGQKAVPISFVDIETGAPLPVTF